MALFSSKKNTKKTKAETTKAAPSSDTAGSFDITPIIRGPRITEKATRAAEHNVYVFNVAPTASKKSIAFAVNARYNVRPLKVRVATVKSKRVVSKGKNGTTGGGKKAYVYLPEGHNIQLA